MANNVLVPLTPQGFGNLWKFFPTGGLSGDLPPGGQDAQYRFVNRLDIARHDMTRAVGFMNNYVTTEIARVTATGTRVTVAMRSTFKAACLDALLAAWNASNHLNPGGGLCVFTSARWCKEKLCNSKWPTDRSTKFDQIGAAGYLSSPPGPITQIPAWYIEELNTLHVAAPVQN